MKVQTTRVFGEIDKAFHDGYGIISCQGGSRSSKTYNILLWLIRYAMIVAGTRISIVRETLPSIKLSVLHDFIEIMKDNGWWSDKQMNRTDRVYTFHNDSTMEFFAASDEQKLRGPKRDILFCNEANELTFLEYQQLKMRTTTLAILDYNPSITDEHWICALNREEKTHFFITTYKDNPFLEQTIIDEIESLRLKNKSLWQIYGLGLQAVVEGLVFPDWQEVDDIPNYIRLAGRRYIGIDFGFSHDPTAIVEVNIYQDCIYIDEICYRTQMLTSDIIAEIKTNNPDHLKVISESADPRLVQEIYRAGINIHPVTKFKGSIEAGIAKMHEYKLCVTKRSYNAQKELKNYVYQQDKEGKWLNQPIDSFNHCFAADTMIKTSNGEKCIVDIKKGDYVLTTKGFKKVTHFFDNGLREICEYIINFGNFVIRINATPEHKVKTKNGWKELRQLTKGDVLFILLPTTEDGIRFKKGLENTGRPEGITNYCLTRFMNHIMVQNRKGYISMRKTVITLMWILKICAAALFRRREKKGMVRVLKSKSSTEKNIGCIKGKDTTPGGVSECTSMCGSFITDLCQRGVKYIIKILMKPIMIFQTLSAYLLKNIKKGIVNLLRCEVKVKSNFNILTGLGCLHQNGIVAKKGKSGTRNISNNVLNTRTGMCIESVLYAEKTSTQKQNRKNSAQIIAKVNIDATSASMMKCEYASGVERSLSQTNTREYDFVAELALENIYQVSKPKERVYDIEVEDTHEYFANGVLVHNCIDSIRYVVLEQLLGGVRRTVPDREIEEMVY